MTLDFATTTRLVLEGPLTIRTAEAVCANLLETVTQHDSVSIDCSTATEVDLSFIQLLIAARATAQPLHRRVVLGSRPDGPLLNTLTRGGFCITPEEESGEATEFWFDGAAA